jgi:hypothetical protein
MNLVKFHQNLPNVPYIYIWDGGTAGKPPPPIPKSAPPLPPPNGLNFACADRHLGRGDEWRCSNLPITDIWNDVIDRSVCTLIRLKRIYNFGCSMLVYTPFALCFVTLRGVFMHFPELTY